MGDLSPLSVKSSINALAIFGGAPAFGDKLHVGRPNIGDRQTLFNRLGEMLDRNWLSNNGPMVQELEGKICETIGVKHCIAVCNATIGLEIAIRALGLSGEVIIPSFTFVATAHALKWQGIDPIFCDVDAVSHTIDASVLEPLITPRTTAIMGVHLWGNSCDIESLNNLSDKFGLRILYDAAHAFGCSHGGKMLGNFGDLEVFSFHATKFLNAFEGGAIVTHSDELAKNIRLMINFGFAGYDNVVALGTNGKMSEPSAAMALTGMESIQDFVEVNYRNRQLYAKHLSGIHGVSLCQIDPHERHNYQYIVCRFDCELTGISRDRMIEILWAENIMARKYFYPGCHQMEPYKSEISSDSYHLPVTETLCDERLVLPTGTGTNAQDIELICGIIRFVVQNCADINLKYSRI